MTSDASKNITAITYNHLNLPRTFTFNSGNTIEMTYDASGMKLSKVVKQGTTIVSRQDYVKGIEYQNSKLQAIYHSEGRVAYCDVTQTQSITAPINGETKNFKAGMITAASTITGSSNVTMQAGTNMTYLPGFQVEQGSTFLGSILPPPCVAATAYEYVIRDHLGNGRIYFADYDGNNLINTTTELLQEAHYDPWGYTLGGSWVNNSAVDNLYQYNGKELNGDLGLGLYDYGARWYDAGVGRWTTVDPMNDKRNWVSPYNYVQNNPLLRIDPDGALDEYQFDSKGAFKGKIEKDGENYGTIENKDPNKESFKFGFADPINDAKAIEEGKITNVKVVDNKSIENSLKKSGVNEKSNRANKYSFIMKESNATDLRGSGSMDFPVNGSVIVDGEERSLSESTLYITSTKSGNLAHNRSNFGNFLWGAGAKSLGISRLMAKLGAHAHNFIYDPKYKGTLDSKDDQFSISLGYEWKK